MEILVCYLLNLEPAICGSVWKLKILENVGAMIFDFDIFFCFFFVAGSLWDILPLFLINVDDDPFSD